MVWYYRVGPWCGTIGCDRGVSSNTDRLYRQRTLHSLTVLPTFLFQMRNHSNSLLIRLLHNG